MHNISFPLNHQIESALKVCPMLRTRAYLGANRPSLFVPANCREAQFFFMLRHIEEPDLPEAFVDSFEYLAYCCGITLYSALIFKQRKEKNLPSHARLARSSDDILRLYGEPDSPPFYEAPELNYPYAQMDVGTPPKSGECSISDNFYLPTLFHPQMVRWLVLLAVLALLPVTNAKTDYRDITQDNDFLVGAIRSLQATLLQYVNYFTFIEWIYFSGVFLFGSMYNRKLARQVYAHSLHCYETNKYGSYSVLDILMPNPRPQRFINKFIFLGFIVETSFYVSICYLTPLMPLLLVMGVALLTNRFHKIILPNPTAIIIMQMYYFCTGCGCRYKAQLAVIGESLCNYNTIFLQLTPVARRFNQVNTIFSQFKQGTLRDFVYVFSFIQLAKQVKLRDMSNIVYIVANLGAYFNITFNNILGEVMNIPFAQSDDYEDTMWNAAFNFLGGSVRIFEKFSRADQAAGKVYVRYTQLLRVARKFFVKHFLDRELTDYDFEYLHPEWYASYHNMIEFSKLTDDQLTGYEVTWMRLEKELLDYFEILRTLDETDVQVTFKSQYLTYTKVMNTMLKRKESLSPAFTDIRQKPTSIVFTGMSDTGKSTNLCKAMAHGLLRDTDFNWMENVYFPCKSSEYWTGYSPLSSTVVMFDDIDPLKNSEIPSSKDEVAWLPTLDMVNTIPMVLNQASIALKGMKFFSKVLVCSNNAEIDTTSFKCPTSIENRHIQIEAIPINDILNFNTKAARDLSEQIEGPHREYGPKFRHTSTTGAFYHAPKNQRDSIVNERGVTVNIERMKQWVNKCESIKDERKRNIAIMSYCKYRVCKGMIPAYFKINGQKLREGDIIDAECLFNMCDEDFKKNKAAYEKLTSERPDSQEGRDMKEFVAKLKNHKPDKPLSYEADIMEIFSKVKVEVIKFVEHYTLPQDKLLKLFAFIAVILGLYLAVSRYMSGAKNDESDSIEEFMNEFGIPYSQAGGDEGYDPSKARNRRTRRPLTNKHGRGWTMNRLPAAQGTALSKMFHTKTDGVIDYGDINLMTNEDYDRFCTYPDFDDQDSDLMLQFTNVQANIEFRTKYVTKSSFVVYVPGIDRPVCKALGIYEKNVLVPHHMIPYLVRGFKLVNPYRQTIVVKPNEFSEIGSKFDVAGVNIPKLPYYFPDIRGNLLHENQLDDIVSAQPQLYVPHMIKETYTLCIASLARAFYKVANFEYLKPNSTFTELVEDPANHTLSIPQYIYYSCTNAPGYCGSILVGTAGSFSGKILGFHIAGGGNLSYATIVTKESIAEIFGAQAQGLTDFRTEPAKYVPISTQSQLKKSKFADEVVRFFPQEKFAPRTSPYWEEGELIFPEQSKLDQFRTLEAGLLNPDVIRIVENDIRWDAGTPLPLLTDMETIKGWGRMKAMDLTTGLGYYLRTTDRREKITDATGRKAYFPHTTHDGRWVTPPGFPSIVVPEITRREEILRIGLITTDYIACPKTNEALKIGKDIRLFYSGDVITQFMVRKYFGTFMSETMDGNVDNEMCVGINAYNFDWKRVIKKLTSKQGSRKIDKDVKGMEYNMYYPETKESVIECIMGFYLHFDKEENIIRRNLLRSLFNCEVIWQGYFHKGFDFNPSGHPMTTLFNCIVLRWWTRYIFYEIMLEDFGSLVAAKYSEECDLVTFGDDSVEAVGTRVQKWYTPERFAEVGDRYGVTFTTASKDRNWIFTTNLTDCNFIKRCFEETEHGIPIPRLEKTSIQTSLLFVKGKHSPEARQSTVDAALLEAHFWGREYFNRIRGCILQAKKRKRLFDLDVKYYEYFSQMRAEMYMQDDLPETITEHTYSEFFK